MPVVGRDRHRDHGAQSASRPALRGAAVDRRRLAPTWCRFPTRPADAPNLKALLADPNVLKIFHFARFDLGMLLKGLRGDAGAGLLHQDRLAADPHLYRPARAEGSGARGARASICPSSSNPPTGARRRSARRRSSYAASDVLHLHALQGTARCHAGARGPRRAGAACFRLSAGPGEARSGRALPPRTFSRIPRRRRPADLPLGQVEADRRQALAALRPCPGHIRRRLLARRTVEYGAGRIGAAARGDNRLTTISFASPERGAGHPARSRGGDKRIYRRAMRHSRHVRWLRVAVIVTVAAFCWRGGRSITCRRSRLRLPFEIGNLVIKGTKITMQQPRLTGYTSDARL